MALVIFVPYFIGSRTREAAQLAPADTVLPPLPGGSAQVRIKLRNIKRGQTVERSFQAGTKWPRASMEKRPVQFLYHEGQDYHFMDTDTYDQFVLTADQLGETAQYMKDGMTLDRTSYQGETIGVELPVTVDPRAIPRPERGS